MRINPRAQLICLHGIWVLVVLMATALAFVAGWLPPISPALNATEVAALYRDEANRIRIAALMIMMGGAFYWPFAAAISNQMKRIEGVHYHPLADAQLACASGTAVAITLASLCWMVAAFRPDRMPEVVQVMNDLAWMPFIGAVPPIFVQVLLIALCVLTDPSPRPVFPRWFGYFQLWIATGFLVGEAICFFHTGAFAWDGLAAFWVAAVLFFGWMVVTWWVVKGAIERHAHTQGSPLEEAEVHE